MKIWQLLNEASEYTPAFKINSHVVKNIFNEHEAASLRKEISRRFAEESIPTDKSPLFARWIMREASRRSDVSNVKSRYIYNGVVEEDALMLIDEIVIFVRYNKSMPIRDINQVRSADLHKMVASVRKKIEKNKEIKQIKSGEAVKTKIGSLTIIEVKSHRAIQIYGANTRWCITMDNPTYWNTYTNNGKYSAYVIIPDNQTEEKYCFIFEAEEFRDSGDDMVNPTRPARNDKEFRKWLISKIGEKKLSKFTTGNVNFKTVGNKHYIDAQDLLDFADCVHRDHVQFVTDVLNGDTYKYIGDVNADGQEHVYFETLATEHNRGLVKKYIELSGGNYNDYVKRHNNKEVNRALSVSASHAIESAIESNMYDVVSQTIIDAVTDRFNVIWSSESIFSKNGIQITEDDYFEAYFAGYEDNYDGDEKWFEISFNDSDFDYWPDVDDVDAEYYNERLEEKMKELIEDVVNYKQPKLPGLE